MKHICTLILACSFSMLYAQESTNSIEKFNELLQSLNTHAKTGQFEKAITEGETALELAKEFNDANMSRQVLYKLTLLYNRTNAVEKEYAAYSQMNVIRKQELQAEDESFKEAFENFKDYYFRGGDIKGSLPLFIKMNDRLMSHTEKSFKYRFVDEKKMFLENNVKPFLDIYQSMAYKNKYKYNSITSAITSNVMTLKSLLLNSSKDILFALGKLNDPKIDKKIKEYRGLRDFITYQAFFPDAARDVNYMAKKERMDALEAELTQLYTATIEEEFSIKQDWSQMRFKSDELAIEFSKFNYYSTHKTDSILYVAYLYKRSWQAPKAIPLFEESQLHAVFKETKNPNTLYTSRGSVSANQTSGQADKIYELVWKPLEPHLKETSTIYYAPDGLLHKVAFSSLSYNKGKTLNEQFNLVRVGTTASIGMEATLPNSESILLFGGIDYERSNEEKGNLIASELTVLEAATRGNQSGWNYLPGTLQEVQAIQDVYPSATIMSGLEASETYFKSLSGNSPSVLHIATHGYFFEDIEANNSRIYEAARDPLMRSGLLLSGANITWKSGQKPKDAEDGILTALEISNLDLSNTDMVIMSACDTGLGDIQGVEGIFGLQRAFKLAGVDILVMSLWQVPDKETAEFMASFYKSWKSGLSIRDAFNTAQKGLQAQYPEEPLKWAAFVLLE